MRILALLEANSITGTAKAVLEFAREAPSVSLEVALFVRGRGVIDNSLTRTLANENMPFRFIREEGRFDFAVMPQLRKLTQQLNPEIIWSNSVKSHFLVHAAGIRKGRKWVAFHHGYTATDLKMRAYNQLDSISLRNADRVITVCQPFATQMIARGVSRPRIRIQHMPIRRFEVDQAAVDALRREFKIEPGTKVILSVGRLSKEKGHVDLINAFVAWRQRNPTLIAKLILVGDGPERSYLQQLATPDSSVLFAGQRDDVNAFYGLAEIFVLPSYSEGTPNVLLEAMSARVPVIATNVGGIPELVTDRQSAILIESGSVSALSAAIENLLTSGSLREQLSFAAESVVTQHSPQAYCQAMLGIFKEVISNA